MSCDLEVPVRSEKLNNKMQRFMDEHFVEFRILTKKKEFGFSRPESYGKSRIGMRLGVSDMGGSPYDYLLTTIRWMAIKVGKKRQLSVFEQLGEEKDSVLYFTWDGQAIPIRLESLWKDSAPKEVRKAKWSFCDDLGCTVFPFGRNKNKIIEIVFLGNKSKKIKKEIQRLDKLWGNYEV